MSNAGTRRGRNNLKQHKRFGLGALGAVGAAAGLLSACTPDSSNIAGVPDAINYNWHVRPILSENCFQCHGPDPESLEANLRLDDGQLALQRLEGPRPRFAIVPGDPDSSELIRRINTTDDEEVMPPQSTHKTLTEAEKQILRSWIDDGAEYQQHWAFVPPERLTPPATELESRVINEIDRFAFRNLERAEIGPSPEADRETLINRISLTLTGMPPTLDAVDAFVADERPGAYSEMVDELLASPTYAEHMSAYWMDLARWSETDGFLDDHHDRWLWPWRDWVISAFNDNMPFDQFGTWQLAGDLLPDATREQILATAFLRVGKRTTENGAIDAEYKAEYMIERTDNALGTAFMGLTLGCARCHDHKYDPIRQYDYYSLGAFFNSNDEPGVYGAGFSGIQGGPTLDWPETPQQSEEVAALAAELARAEQSYSDALANAAPRVRTRAASVEAAAATIESSLSASLAAYYPFETVLAADLADLPPPRPPNDPPRSIVRIQRNPYGARQSATEANDASLDEQTRARRERDRLLLGVPRNYVQDELMLSPAGSTGVADAVIQGPILEQGVRGQALFFDETNKG